jgi:chloramphenicol O-acetyltransferase type A
MKHKLDFENWVRKPHYEFFRTFDDPFYGVSVPLDTTEAYRFAKDKGVSFYLYLLHLSLVAAHRIECFRYRIEEGSVFIYDRIDAASTIALSNGYFRYHQDLQYFLDAANRETERVRAASDLVPNGVGNTILYSALPWIDFTALSHARKFTTSSSESSPRISFGKMTETAGKRSMPMSIHVNHALIDGLNIGQYIDSFQQLLDGESL